MYVYECRAILMMSAAGSTGLVAMLGNTPQTKCTPIVATLWPCAINATRWTRTVQCLAATKLNLPLPEKKWWRWITTTLTKNPSISSCLLTWYKLMHAPFHTHHSTLLHVHCSPVYNNDVARMRVSTHVCCIDVATAYAAWEITSII